VANIFVVQIDIYEASQTVFFIIEVSTEFRMRSRQMIERFTSVLASTLMLVFPSVNCRNAVGIVMVTNMASFLSGFLLFECRAVRFQNPASNVCGLSVLN